jgi:predicted AAA+ superfamily ATPase
VAHYLIENTDKHFILSGSSARKIKKNAANLLAGRAFVYHLFPFTFQELGAQFDLENALQWGMLPKIYQYKDERQKKKFLQAYAHTYLKEEVWTEHLIRNLDPFRYFLEVAAQCNGKIINYSKIARDVGVDYKTVENYYSILEDTFLGFFVHAYDGSFRKQINQAPKFYLFDTGVARSLARMLSVPAREKTNYYGDLFEQFIIVEIKKFIEYHQNEYCISFLRTKTDMEIDLIVHRPGKKILLIEIKSSRDVQPEQLKYFDSLIEEFPDCEAVCLSQDPNKKKFGKITVWPWKEAILNFFK